MFLFEKDMRGWGWNPKFRIATLNVDTIVGKWNRILDIMEERELDVLCIQEAKERKIGTASFRAKLEKEGLYVFMGDARVDSAGAKQAGMMTISRWPMKGTGSEVMTMYPDRVLATQASIIGARPFRIYNIYLHSGDARKATELGKKIIDEAIQEGDDTIIIGDWNKLPEEMPACSYVANGAMHLADEIISGAKDLPTHEQRHIDYAIVKGQYPVDREQYPGVGKHDLVIYTFDIDRRPEMKRWTTYKKLMVRKDLEHEEWETAWQGAEEAFNEAEEDKDIDLMWNTWTKVVEELHIDPEGKAKRSRTEGPKAVQQQAVANKVPDFRSIKERKIRRIARRAEELNRHFVRHVHNKQVRRLRILKRSFPTVDCFKTADYQTLYGLADEQARADRKARVEARKEQLSKSEDAVRDYIKREEPPVGTRKDRINPREEVQGLVKDWEKWWMRPPATPPDNLDETVRRLFDHIEQLPEIKLTARDLKKAANRSRKSAAGIDGWKGAIWANLPLSAFEPLVRIWNMALAEGTIPEVWNKIRTVTIPKDDGGSRPISVAVLAWRTGMGALISRMGPWIDTWAQEQIAGGIPGRDARKIHENLHTEIEHFRLTHHLSASRWMLNNASILSALSRR